MRRYISILSILIFIALTGCIKEAASLEYTDIVTADHSSKSLPEKDSQQVDPFHPDIEFNLEDNTSSESDLLSILAENTDKEILYHHFDDYDNDGTSELFAVVGDKVDAENFDSNNGQIWFANQDGAQRLYFNGVDSVDENSRNLYDASARVFAIDTIKFFVVPEGYFGPGMVTYMYGVHDGMPYKTNLSGTGGTIGINEFGDVETAQHMYDVSYPSLQDALMDNNALGGSSDKAYYFYWNGESFSEYGALELSLEQVNHLPGIVDAVNEISGNGGTIFNVLYRENHFLTINYYEEEDDEDWLWFSFKTLYIENGHAVELDSLKNENENNGICKTAIMPEIATFPTQFPY